MPQAEIGIIGGSGLYRMPDLTDVEQVDIDTPFGPPSDAVTIGTLAGARVAFLPRHGQHHQISPTHVPARANVWALKSIGVRRLVSVSAVGSLREDFKPLDMVVADQIFDRTVGRSRTFFADGPVVHVSMADPFCSLTRGALLEAAEEAGANVHNGGTYICIEGPQFSTKGESRVYRSWGMDIIGMTAMPEARLAREAELCYALLAMVTDYDVWHEVEEPVSVQTVIENLRKNVGTAQAVVRAVIPRLTRLPECACGHALEHAIVTGPEAILPDARERFGLLLGKYLG